MIDLQIPRHGGQLTRIAQHFGVDASSLLDFSANINPDGPPASVAKAIRMALDDPSVLTQYPDLEEINLRSAISIYAGVPSESILVANGFVPLLEAALRALPIRSCLLPVPCFGEYRHALERAAVSVETFALDQGMNFQYDSAELMEALLKGQHDAIVLANPQNPSGVLWNRENVSIFVERALSRDIIVLLDEAFIDYCPGHSLTGEVNRYPNLIVFRSVTKFHGLPGLRVAYAVANAKLSQSIRLGLAPWAVTTLAAIGVCAALTDDAYLNRTLRLNEQRKNWLVRQLQEMDLICYPSAANFVLLRIPGMIDVDACWERLVRDSQIVLRHCSNFEGLETGHLRSSVHFDEENARLVEALKLATEAHRK